ncbi:hypothetical protein J3R82DRAFT_11191 [Butyriboletus roseoflavus]|nr:hypothetical protein J3R82DRAFT_11191 [Butyriboletus roseoflavus]
MRRGNKSHKVPNVKLRPAPPLTRSARVHDPSASCDRSDSEVPPNPSMVDLCPRPFKGFSICATGTIDKPTLFKMAFELGAISTSDFTDRVTHLIANSHGGAKYLCALERKIPIMSPDWITEAHAIWLRGDDVDVEQGIAKHRLPIFSGVVLSLSGIDDLHRRTEINRLVTLHQGIYLKNLERPVRVTHLLCSGDTETDKMKYAEKFNKHKEAHIHLVWEEWFWDCLEFGGRFDERKYQVSRPRPERKSLHENPISSHSLQGSSPGSHPNLAIPVDSVNQPKRLKAVVPAGSFTVINNLPTDGEEEETAIINKPVPAVTLQLWQSLLKPRGFELDGGKLVRSPSKSQAMRSPPSTPTQPRAWPSVVNRNGTVEHGKEKEKESVISSFRRATLFVPVPVKEPAVRQPFRRNTPCLSACFGEAEWSGLHDPIQPGGEPALPTLFAGCTFRLLGEARCPKVRSAIENGGGVVTDDDAEEPDFIVVRLISGSKLYHDEFDDNARTKYRTECWLEHSIFQERICGPDENASFTPLKITMPVPAERVPSLDKALEWRIPVVSLAWLEDIARTGTIPRVDEYLIGGSHVGASADEDGFGYAQDLDPVPEVRRDKGKGKEKQMDYQMMDITNDGLTNQPMFVKNAALLQDTALRNQEPDTRQHRGKTLEPRSPTRDGLFGEPRFLMHDPDPPEDAAAQANYPTTSSPVDPPPQSISPLLVEAKVPLPEPTPPILASLVPLHVTPVRQPSGSIHDEAQARIPSSTSPSPMKLPPSSSVPNAFVASSPARIPDSDAITKALHESLTSLLGKRPIAEEDEVMMRDVAGAAGAKKGKRVRPGGRSNMTSRDASRENVGGDFTSPHRPAFRPSVLSSPVAPPPDIDMSLLDGLGMGGLRSTEESMRVTYEDPGQAEEKRRLLRMLGGDEAEAGVVAVMRRLGVGGVASGA